MTQRIPNAAVSKWVLVPFQPSQPASATTTEQQNALSEAGGEQYLARQANENPSAFMTLLGKVLPTQVTGHEGGPVKIVTGVRRCEDHEEAAPAPSS